MEMGFAYKVAHYRSPGIYKSCIIKGKYSECYKIGKTVTAREGTLGIFCFKTRELAKSFVHNNWGSLMNNPNPTSILKVKPIGAGVVPKSICRIHNPWRHALKLIAFYEKGESCARTNGVPIGTICYPAVEVLEEVVHDICN